MSVFDDMDVIVDNGYKNSLRGSIIEDLPAINQAWYDVFNYIYYHKSTLMHRLVDIYCNYIPKYNVWRIISTTRGDLTLLLETIYDPFDRIQKFNRYKYTDIGFLSLIQLLFYDRSISPSQPDIYRSGKYCNNYLVGVVGNIENKIESIEIESKYMMYLEIIINELNNYDIILNMDKIIEWVSNHRT
jgi:hypothetical protein